MAHTTISRDGRTVTLTLHVQEAAEIACLASHFLLSLGDNDERSSTNDTPQAERIRGVLDSIRRIVRNVDVDALDADDDNEEVSAALGFRATLVRGDA